MEKVKITKEQAKAIEELKSTWTHQSKEFTIGKLTSEKASGYVYTLDCFKAVNELDLNTFVLAITEGYEIINELHENLKEENRKNMEYTDRVGTKWDKGYDHGWRNGVNAALKQVGEQPIYFF